MEENYIKYIDFFSEDEIRDFLETDKKSFIAVMPKAIADKDELMHVYFDKLNLASYFGGNWDAMDEILVDFDWVNAEKIIIVHLDIPNLTVEDQKMLIDVLSGAVKTMAEGPRKEFQLPTGKHTLQVIFPSNEKSKIEKLFKL